MEIDVSFTCAFCGELVDTTVDPSAGANQSYVEDCQVCCRPNVLRIRVDAEGGTAWIDSELES